MIKNIHPIERVIRMAAGLVLTSMAFIGPTNSWYLLGLIPLVTGFVGVCPIYSVLGFSTLRITGRSHRQS